MEIPLGEEQATQSRRKNDVAILHESVEPGHFIDCLTTGEQPLMTFNEANGMLPVYTTGIRSDSYFMPATGLDFLIGVPEVLLLQTTSNLTSTDFVFMVKIPKKETLYLAMENSTIMQKALLGSQRSFNMTFLDPNKQEAVTFIRKGAVTNLKTFFRQELVAFMGESNTPLGRIRQNNSLSTVSFSIMNEQDKHIYEILGSESTVLRRLNQEVHFSILDPVDRTGGVILHKWDDNHKDFVYHITFPATSTAPQHKILLIGMALLVEYTYFKKTGCFCFT